MSSTPVQWAAPNLRCSLAKVNVKMARKTYKGKWVRKQSLSSRLSCRRRLKGVTLCTRFLPITGHSRFTLSMLKCNTLGATMQTGTACFESGPSQNLSRCPRGWGTVGESGRMQSRQKSSFSNSATQSARTLGRVG